MVSENELTENEKAAQSLLAVIKKELNDKIKKEIENQRLMETIGIQIERQSVALENIAKTLASLEAEVARHFLKNDV